MKDASTDGLAEIRLRHPAPSRRQAVQQRPKPGDIFRALPMDGAGTPALVLVTASTPHTEAHSVVLLSPDTGLGGDRDLLLWQDDTGLPYALLAETDVFGYLWTVQLDRRLGVVTSDVLQTVAHMQSPEPDCPDPDRRAGPPALTPRDPRWQFKPAELARLTQLSGECTKQLIDGEDHVVVDPVALRAPHSHEDPLGTAEFILRLVEQVQEGTVDFPAWLIDRILADESLADAYRHVGLFDAYQVLLRLTETWLCRVGNESVPVAPDRALPQTAASGLEAARHAIFVEELQHGHSSVRLFTRSEDVGDEPAERVYVGGEMIQCVRTARNA